MKIDAKPNIAPRGQRWPPLQGRRFTHALFDDYISIPDSLGKTSQYLCVLLAMDARTIKDDALEHLSALLLQHGVVYFCAWGSDCERMHDCFDSQRLEPETNANVIMTTWHTNDTIEDVARFFVWATMPAEDYEGKCEWIAYLNEVPYGTTD